VTNVLVTAVGGGVGQSIVKSLRPTDYVVVGMDSDALAAGLYAVPTARIGRAARDPRFVDSISDVCREEHCSLVFPGLEPELLPLSENAARLAAEGVTAVVSRPEVVRCCDDKLATAAFLAEHGFSAPTTIPFTEDVDRSWFPFVLKPRHGGARSVRTYVVRDQAEFEVARTLVDAQNCVVQEYIDGDEYTCGTVNLDGACRGVIVMRRSLRDGDTYKAFVVRDESIEKRIAEIADVLGPFGPCNFQFRCKGGEPWIFEINARCSGTTYARALAGFNEPRMVADHVLHGVAPTYEIREIAVLRYWNELTVPPEHIAQLRDRGRLDGGGASL
jgi:carbamoyl-phosphate synthase large subunit